MLWKALPVALAPGAVPRDRREPHQWLLGGCNTGFARWARPGQAGLARASAQPSREHSRPGASMLRRRL